MLSQDSLSQSLYTCFNTSTGSEADAVITPLHHTFESLDAGPAAHSEPSK